MRAPQIAVHEHARRKCPHPAGVRPTVAVEQTLVILGRSARHEPLAGRDHEVRQLLAGEALFEHHARAGVAEGALDHRRAHRRLRGREVGGDHHALAGGEPVGFHHHGPAQSARREGAHRGVGRVAHDKRRRRHAVALHDALGERLARLELRGRLGRSEDRASGLRRNRSATPAASGASGPMTVRSAPSAAASASTASGSVASTGATGTSRAMPGLPGAQTTDVPGSEAICTASACSRAPPPTTRTFMRLSAVFAVTCRKDAQSCAPVCLGRRRGKPCDSLAYSPPGLDRSQGNANHGRR